MQGVCGTHKTRFKILDSDFTYYGVYVLYFRRLSQLISVQLLKNKL